MSLTVIRYASPGVEAIQFRPDAAESFLRVQEYLGRTPSVNRTVVPYDTQMALYRLRQAGKYPWPVAHPDYSDHVYRTDTSGGNAWDTEERGDWLNDFGWIETARTDNPKTDEPWHRAYIPSKDKRKFTGAISGKEIVDMSNGNPIVNRVEKYGDTAAENSRLGTLYIAADNGTVVKYVPPFDPNVRNVVSLAFLDGNGKNDTIPTLNSRDFDTFAKFWRIMKTGK